MHEAGVVVEQGVQVDFGNGVVDLNRAVEDTLGAVVVASANLDLPSGLRSPILGLVLDRHTAGAQQ